MKKILTRYLILTVQNTYPEGDGIFQQDLAPRYTSKMMQNYFEKYKLSVSEWLGNSPDLHGKLVDSPKKVAKV